MRPPNFLEGFKGIRHPRISSKLMPFKFCSGQLVLRPLLKTRTITRLFPKATSRFNRPRLLLSQGLTGNNFLPLAHIRPTKVIRETISTKETKRLMLSLRQKETARKNSLSPNRKGSRRVCMSIRTRAHHVLQTTARAAEGSEDTLINLQAHSTTTQIREAIAMGKTRWGLRMIRSSSADVSKLSRGESMYPKLPRMSLLLHAFQPFSSRLPNYRKLNRSATELVFFTP